MSTSSVPPVVRAVTPADHPLVVRLMEELATGDAPPAIERWTAVYMPNSWIFEHGGRVVAYAMFEILSATGYIRHVVVDPSARGRGFGHAVMGELTDRLRAAGCRRMCLNVKPDNFAAIHVYEAAGMRRIHASAAFRLAWACVGRLPAPGETLHAEPALPEDDEVIERTFDLERGIVQSRRQRAEMVVLVLRDRARPMKPAGLACFDPHFPGVSPFRARDPAAARALLEALRSPARDLSEISVSVENHPALIQAFKDAGAEVRLEYDHYRRDL